MQKFTKGAREMWMMLEAISPGHMLSPAPPITPPLGLEEPQNPSHRIFTSLTTHMATSALFANSIRVLDTFSSQPNVCKCRSNLVSLAFSVYHQGECWRTNRSHFLLKTSPFYKWNDLFLRFLSPELELELSRFTESSS